ncbi:hypothetical protein HDU76_008141 [Blyttiomyces sp. JEL0837]|nr:hypothetical protein HDU76_008141 [Blyttiomyces sp. JEL0837]
MFTDGPRSYRIQEGARERGSGRLTWRIGAVEVLVNARMLALDSTHFLSLFCNLNPPVMCFGITSGSSPEFLELLKHPQIRQLDLFQDPNSIMQDLTPLEILAPHLKILTITSARRNDVFYYEPLDEVDNVPLGSLRGLEA